MDETRAWCDDARVVGLARLWFAACVVMLWCCEGDQTADAGAASQQVADADREGDALDASPALEGPDAECRARAANEYTVRLVGDGFDVHEGKLLFGVNEIDLASAPEVACRASGRVEIQHGAFDLGLSNLTDEAIYPSVLAFIDVDGNGVCDVDVDLAWASFPSWAFLTLSLTPADFSTGSAESVCGQSGLP